MESKNKKQRRKKNSVALTENQINEIKKTLTDELGLTKVKRYGNDYLFRQLLETHPEVDVNKIIEYLNRKDVNHVEKYFSDKFHTESMPYLTGEIRRKYKELSWDILMKMIYKYGIKFKGRRNAKFLSKMIESALLEMHSKESDTLRYLEAIVEEIHHDKMVEIFDKVLTEFKIYH